MRLPTISERVSFRWTPNPPSEPTITLVVTSPGGYFVDVRVLKPTASEPKSLQWAFAGRASHETVNGKSKGSWVHLVDSKHPSGFEDSGVFEDLPNGDSLEKGAMMDDVSGVVRDYEEVWHDYVADPPRFRVMEGSGGGVRGFFILMAQYALGIVKDAENRIGVSKWVEESGEWQRVFNYGDLQNHLPSPSSTAGLEPPPSSWDNFNWLIIEENDILP